MHSTHVGIVGERQSGRLGLALRACEERRSTLGWAPPSAARRPPRQRPSAHRAGKRGRDRGSAVKTASGRERKTPLLFWRGIGLMWEQPVSLRAIPGGAGGAGAAFRAVILLLRVWEASADGLWFRCCEYLSGFACWNTSSDLFYSPSPVHSPAEKWVRKQRRKMPNQLTGKRKEKR